MSVKVINYDYTPARLYPVDDAHPEEVDYDIEVESDISGDDITGEEIWEIDDNLICSKDEMLEYFNEEYVSPVETEEEYIEAKKHLIEEEGYKEEDFNNNPKLLRIDYGDEVRYAFEENFDPIEDHYLPDDWCELDDSDLEEIAFDGFDPYDDGEEADRAYDEWVERQLTDED